MPNQPLRPSSKGTGTAPSMRRRPLGRVLILGGLCAACLVVLGLTALSARQRIESTPAQAADAAAPHDVLASVTSRPHLVFLHSPTGDQYRQVAIVPLDAPDGPRYLTSL